MGSYRFERIGQDDPGAAGNALRADVEQALLELDWVEEVHLRGDTGDGSVTADVHFDPDWPDRANPDVVAEVFQRFNLHVVDDPSAAASGKVMAADPLRASASVGDDGGLDLFVFNED
jgi:hypothetical protein